MTSGEKTVIRLPGFLVLNNQKNYADPTRADVLTVGEVPGKNTLREEKYTADSSTKCNFD